MRYNLSELELEKLKLKLECLIVSHQV